MLLQTNELKINEDLEIEFLNGSKLVAKFVGMKSGRYYFIDSSEHQFSIANNTIEYYRFSKFN